MNELTSDFLMEFAVAFFTDGGQIYATINIVFKNFKRERNGTTLLDEIMEYSLLGGQSGDLESVPNPFKGEMSFIGQKRQFGRNLTKKVIQKVASNERIILPKKWRDLLALDDSSEIELELDESLVITVRKHVRHLAIEYDLFAGVDLFTEDELEDAKRSLFPSSSKSG